MEQNLQNTAEKVIKEIESLQLNQQDPIIVAIDGGSGAGKSTLATRIEGALDTALIPLDDFFSGHIPDNRWDTFTVEAKLEHVFDWALLRKRVLDPLSRRKPAKWYAFDFQSGLRPDGTYGKEDTPKRRDPAEVILIEGAYSASHALSDLVDLTVLVDVPEEERHARFKGRETHEFLEKWHRRWDEVEEYYFSKVKPKNSFDLVVCPVSDE